MKRVFPEWGRTTTAGKEDETYAGYFQVWNYEGPTSQESIPASDKEFEMTTSLLKIYGIPLVLKRDTYNSQLGVITGAYNAASYLLNGSHVLLNELESPEATKERIKMDFVANLPKKTLAITSSNISDLIKAAKILQLPLDETLKKAEIEYLRNNS